MSTVVCDGHVESGAACDGHCDPHREAVRAAIARQDSLRALAWRLSEAGTATEPEISLLYRLSEEAWDDAIHIAAPDDGHVSLCGQRGRNLVALSAERPNGWEGCWGCLQRADRLGQERVA